MRWLIGKGGMKEEGPMSPPVKGGGWKEKGWGRREKGGGWREKGEVGGRRRGWREKGGVGDGRVGWEGEGWGGSVWVCGRRGGRRVLTCLKAAIAGSHASMSAAESLGLGVIEKPGGALAAAACCPRISSRNRISALECESALEFSARRAASEARGIETSIAALFD